MEELTFKQWEKIGIKNKWILKNYYYSEEMAKNTKDPEILRRILRKVKDDWVSCLAVENPNCPPEMLARVLKIMKNDEAVSYYAAIHPNCPPEALAEVLKRGENDSVSDGAADNPNCPPEALKEWKEHSLRNLDIH